MRAVDREQRQIWRVAVDGLRAQSGRGRLADAYAFGMRGDAAAPPPAKAVSPEALAKLQLGVEPDGDVPDASLVELIQKLREQISQFEQRLAQFENAPMPGAAA